MENVPLFSRILHPANTWPWLYGEVFMHLHFACDHLVENKLRLSSRGTHIIKCCEVNTAQQCFENGRTRIITRLITKWSNSEHNGTGDRPMKFSQVYLWAHNALKWGTRFPFQTAARVKEEQDTAAGLHRCEKKWKCSHYGTQCISMLITPATDSTVMTASVQKLWIYMCHITSHLKRGFIPSFGTCSRIFGYQRP